jgi:hypothetical protein
LPLPSFPPKKTKKKNKSNPCSKYLFQPEDFTFSAFKCILFLYELYILFLMVVYTNGCNIFLPVFMPLGNVSVVAPPSEELRRIRK